MRCRYHTCSSLDNAESVIKVRQSRVGVVLELELNVAVVIHKDKSGLDVEFTKVNVPGNLDHIRETHTAHVCMVVPV